jgi:hypothetical protein
MWEGGGAGAPPFFISAISASPTTTSRMRSNR